MLLYMLPNSKKTYGQGENRIMGRIIAIANQKGGVGKTTTTINLAAGLSMKGKKVLVIDSDPQGDSTSGLGWNPDEVEITLSNIYEKIIKDELATINLDEGILHHVEGIDLLPSDIELCGMENTLGNVTCGETLLKEYTDIIQDKYDYILIDCMPALGKLTINALTCADEVIIPVQAAALPAKGLQQLIRSIGTVKRRLNPNIKFGGILITMVRATNNAKILSAKISEMYGAHIRLFNASIPLLVGVEEQANAGVSIFKYNARSAGANAYMKVVEEVLGDEIIKQ